MQLIPFLAPRVQLLHSTTNLCAIFLSLSVVYFVYDFKNKQTELSRLDHAAADHDRVCTSYVTRQTLGCRQTTLRCYLWPLLRGVKTTAQ